MKFFKRKEVQAYDVNSGKPPTIAQLDLVIEKARKHTRLAQEAPQGSESRILNTKLASSCLNEAKILKDLMDALDTP